MDFGKVADPSGVDFTLPGDPPETTALLRRLAAGGPLPSPRLRLGSPRWADPGYLGKIIPSGTARADLLRHYARSFDAIELNTTWYAYDGDQLARWAAMTPERFRFWPKFPQEISLDRRLVGCDDRTGRFLEAVERLGSRRGRCWLLLPQDLGPRELPALEEFLRTWAPRTPLAVEFRHPGWFREPAAGNAFMLLESLGVAAVLTDVAGRRDVLHMRPTAPQLMIRFVGNALHPTDFTRLDAWAERLAGWMASGLPEICFFLHQPEEHLCVEAAEHLAAALARTGVDVPPPRRVPGQPTLF